jgi:hypothetical protein
VSKCKCCINLERELKEVQDELSSAKLIIKLLQSESNSNECTGYRTIEPRNLIQCSSVNASSNKENEWIEVTTGHHTKTKQIATTKELGSKEVVTENRYHVLQSLQETNGVAEGFGLKKTRSIVNTGARSHKKKKHKAILIGDSHARGCAEKLSNYLGKAYEVIGYVSPNAGLDVITNSAKEEIDQLTQKDVMIVCGGTNNISKNESDKGLRYVTQLVHNKRNTNMIIINAPHRFDLEESSCVNKEVKVFNRKLNEIVERYSHVKAVDMSTKRDHYTRHGLHMNKTGKDWITRKTADVINKLFATSKPAPITPEQREMVKDNPGKNNEETERKTTTLEMDCSTQTTTRLIQEETGNKSKQSTEMKEKCGNQGGVNEVDGRNTCQGNKDTGNNEVILKSTQDSANRNSERRLNRIEDDASRDNSDVKNDEVSVLPQTTYKTPMGIVSSDNSDVKNDEDSVQLQTADQGGVIEVDGRNTCHGNKDTGNNEIIIKSTQNSANRNSKRRLNRIEDDASSDNSDVKNDEVSVLLQTTYKAPMGSASSVNSDIKNDEDSVLPQTTYKTPMSIVSSVNSDVKNDEDSVLLLTPYTTPMGIASNENSDNSDVKNDEDSILSQTTDKTTIGITVYPGTKALDGKIGEEPKNLDLPSYPRRNCPAKKDPNYLWT